MRWLEGIIDSMDIEFEQTLGDGEGQGCLACCSPWGCKELDTTEQLNNNCVCLHGYMGLPLLRAGLTPQPEISYELLSRSGWESRLWATHIADLPVGTVRLREDATHHSFGEGESECGSVGQSRDSIKDPQADLDLPQWPCLPSSTSLWRDGHMRSGSQFPHCLSCFLLGWILKPADWGAWTCSNALASEWFPFREVLRVCRWAGCYGARLHVRPALSLPLKPFETLPYQPLLQAACLLHRNQHH